MIYLNLFSFVATSTRALERESHIGAGTRAGTQPDKSGCSDESAESLLFSRCPGNYCGVCFVDKRVALKNLFVSLSTPAAIINSQGGLPFYCAAGVFPPDYDCPPFSPLNISVRRLCPSVSRCPGTQQLPSPHDILCNSKFPVLLSN